MANKVYYGEYSLEHWIHLILTKNIVLPEYQRSFVWSEEKVRNLVTSFQNDLFIPPVTIGSYEKSDETLNLVLDGQQRLTSILLAYLKVYPNKSSFKAINSEEKIYQNDNEMSDDEDGVLEWTFSQIQSIAESKNAIKAYFNNLKDDSNYNSLQINISNDFFENHYLGFSFLIPESKVLQKNYYASVFRDINTQGVDLLPQESRESLYFLDENLKLFFKPSFASQYKVKAGNTIASMDFVRYISIISQYANDSNVNNIAKGTQGKLEKYYIEYIYSVINDTKSDRFGQFSQIFLNELWKSRFDNLKNCLKLIVEDKHNFDSIIYLDVVMFGLVYFVVFKDKTLNQENLEKLRSELRIKADKFKKDISHSKAPNSLKYIKQRVNASITIYEEFIDESA